MKTKWLLAVGLMVLAAPSRMEAQSQNPKPAPPYLASASGNRHWKVTLTYPDDLGFAIPGSPANDLPASIETIQGGEVARMTITFQQAPPLQVDQTGTYMVKRTLAGLQLLGLSYDPLLPPYPLQTKGFLFAEWVRKEAADGFKDVVFYRGVLCFYYRKENAEGRFNPDNGQEAWIDVQTMLPVAAKQAGIEADYQFYDAPTSPVQLPADEVALIQARTNALKAVSLLR